MSYTGDGHDYAVWYNGMIIDYIKAASDEKAQEFAQRIWGDSVHASRLKQ
jgi:hypothetical protein